jgi:glycine cleavage system aminomethyltransferase T
MTTQKPDDPEPSEKSRKPRDPDFIGAEAALSRAAERARRRAFETVGAVAVFKNGRVVWEKADGTYVGDLEDGRN